MSNPNDFTNEGFTVLDTQNNSKNSPLEGWQPQADGVFPSQNMDLLQFLKTNYPSIIKDNEINISELKAISGLPVDEKTNGYGLNFVGRNVARSRYAQKTEKELKLNQKLSKNIDTTKNLILKGDNLDSLKILKSHYQNKIKCIYIDPPYNTSSDEFVYPDKFNKEEAEVLGIATETADFERMEFSFKTKKSHSGWLSFMYPRLMLARDLLKDDGVIFISIDDNEQANLKLLCDEIFGEENFVGDIIRKTKSQTNDAKTGLNYQHEFVLVYAKFKDNFILQGDDKDFANYKNPDNDPMGNWMSDNPSARSGSDNALFEIKNPFTGTVDLPPKGRYWAFAKSTFEKWIESGKVVFKKTVKQGERGFIVKKYLSEVKNSYKQVDSLFGIDNQFMNQVATKELNLMLGDLSFTFPKPISFIHNLIKYSTSPNDLILDFFAGSGTTGHAVMQLNSEDGGNRKFILCQIDEPIKKDKPAYKFCKDNDLEPVISSITIERLKRAGEKLKVESEKLKVKNEGNLGQLDFEENSVEAITVSPLDTGFKVFDSVDSPRLALVEENPQNSPLEGWQPTADGVDTTQTNTQVELIIPQIDSLSRIYNIIFSVGLDEPSQIPETVLKDCIYKIGNNYYITNSEKISKEQLSEVIKSGRVFIDGWTASLNATLQNYKEDVKIVF
jgi:adenine-specific DNA-methyltransferase